MVALSSKTATILFILLLTGVAHAETGPRGRASYDSLFPHYALVCTASRYEKVGVDVGGIGGHAVVYFKGMCRDRTSPLPRVRLCREGEVDLSSPEAGVGISVDGQFKNVNWVAIEGLQLFMHGIPPEPPKQASPAETRAAQVAAVNQSIELAYDQGLFRGIRLSEKAQSKRHPSWDEGWFVAHYTLGTDYALTLARNLHCARVPLRREMIGQAAEYLNQLNEQYYSGNREYNWSPFRDNCTHTVHNALAAAGIGNFKKTNRNPVVQLGNMAVPSNEFTDTIYRHNEHTLDPLRLFNDSSDRELVMKHGRLPVQAGVISTFYPFNEAMDGYFATDLFYSNTLDLVLDAAGLDKHDLFSKFRHRKLTKVFRTAKYNDLEANLGFIASRYEKALKRLRPLWQYQLDLEPELHEEFERFYGAYTEALNRDLEDTRSKLRALRE